MAVLKRKPLVLPTKKSEIPTSISQYSVFIYGQQKIGKTSLTSKFPKALHFFFEPSGTDYELFEVAPKNWDEFLQYITLLEKQEEAGELQFETFILDVVDLAYEMCLKHHSGLQGLDYPPKNDFGQTWKEIKDGFRAALIRLARIGGIVCVSHHKEVAIETLRTLLRDEQSNLKEASTKMVSITKTLKSKVASILYMKDQIKELRQDKKDLELRLKDNEKIKVELSKPTKPSIHSPDYWKSLYLSEIKRKKNG